VITSAGRAKKDGGRGWESVVAMEWNGDLDRSFKEF